MSQVSALWSQWLPRSGMQWEEAALRGAEPCLRSAVCRRQVEAYASGPLFVSEISKFPYCLQLHAAASDNWQPSREKGKAGNCWALIMCHGMGQRVLGISLAHAWYPLADPWALPGRRGVLCLYPMFPESCHGQHRRVLPLPLLSFLQVPGIVLCTEDTAGDRKEKSLPSVAFKLMLFSVQHFQENRSVMLFRRAPS